MGMDNTTAVVTFFFMMLGVRIHVCTGLVARAWKAKFLVVHSRRRTLVFALQHSFRLERVATFNIYSALSLRLHSDAVKDIAVGGCAFLSHLRNAARFCGAALSATVLNLRDHLPGYV